MTENSLSSGAGGTGQAIAHREGAGKPALLADSKREEQDP
jgi:hypothetical protein